MGDRPERVIASEPTPGQIIAEIHAWIATYRDGTEGIIGAELTLGMMPLLSSRKHFAEAMAPTAHRAAALVDDVVGVRLVTFTTTEGSRQ